MIGGSGYVKELSGYQIIGLSGYRAIGPSGHRGYRGIELSGNRAVGLSGDGSFGPLGGLAPAPEDGAELRGFLSDDFRLRLIADGQITRCSQPPVSFVRFIQGQA